MRRKLQVRLATDERWKYMGEGCRSLRGELPVCIPNGQRNRELRSGYATLRQLSKHDNSATLLHWILPILVAPGVGRVAVVAEQLRGRLELQLLATHG